MRRAGMLTIAGAVVLLLAGCTQAPSTEAEEPASDSSSATLVAESPASSSTASSEAAFVDEVRGSLRPDTQIGGATDEQLLDAGLRACEVLAAGTDTTGLSIIEGEQPNVIGAYPDSEAVITAAAVALC